MARHFSRLCFFMFVAGLLAVSNGCKPRLLPNSSVEDTTDNRLIAEFMAEYVKAIEQRSTEAVMALVSKDYVEEHGQSEGEGYYDYSHLREKLDKTFELVKELRLVIHLQKVIKKDDIYEVFYAFRQNALINFQSGEKWMTASDVNRLVLRMKGANLTDGLEVLSGL